ncbi:MAG: hypothetical protein JNK48_26020 [Bryobacterales bacterium]|nr:hypothetical protein [Bryobacterales bacterium]
MTIRFAGVAVFMLLAGCSREGKSPVPSTGQPISTETIVTPDGVTRTVKTYPHEEDEEDHPLGVQGSGDNFLGTARKAAKLSIASGTVTSTTLCTFLQNLPTDTSMRSLNIPKGADSGRVKQEDFNASFKAFIYASSFPADNDYHVILGDVSANPTCLLNVEVSGLPASTEPSFATLDNVRKAYKACMGSALPSGGYKTYDPPLEVTIQGSGFFDVSHASGTIGPSGLKPATAWELHPITGLSCP